MMEKVMLEVLKSKFVGNALESAVENKKFHYSIPEGIIDTVNVCNAIAQEINAYNQQQTFFQQQTIQWQMEQHQKTVSEVITYYCSKWNYG